MIDYLGRAPSRLRLLKGETPDWIKNSSRGDYIRSVILSAPPWVDRKELEAMRQRAIWMSEMTGVPHHLDHIIPLKHPRVCGLTVPWNIRIVPWNVNMSKGNSWCPDQLELFDEKYQRARPKRKAAVRRDGEQPKGQEGSVLGLREEDGARVRQADLWESAG